MENASAAEVGWSVSEMAKVGFEADLLLWLLVLLDRVGDLMPRVTTGDTAAAADADDHDEADDEDGGARIRGVVSGIKSEFGKS